MKRASMILHERRRRIQFVTRVSEYAKSLICLALWFVTFAFTSLAAETPPRWNPPIPPIPAKNLVPNSSFELGSDGWSSLGTVTAGGGDLCGLYGVIQAGDAYDGERCLRIELGPGKTPVTHSDYTLGASRTVVQAAPLAATLGWMSVEDGRTYTLSAFMRADRDGVPADLVFRFGGEVNTGFGSDTHRKRVTLTRDWVRYEFSMAAPSPDVFVALGPNLSETPEASAAVWVDAVQLEMAEPSAYVPREPVEAGINSGHYGNLFDCGDPVGFTICGTNITATDANIEIHAQVEDYFGDTGPSSSCVLAIPTQDPATAFLPLTVPGAGYYRAHVSWDVSGVAHTRTIKFSVVDTYRWKDSAFGLNHVPTTAGACNQLRKAGVTWARDWSMKWESVESVEGTYDFAEVDRQVGRILDVPMNLLPLLPPQPSTAWASEAPADGLPPVERTAYAPTAGHRTKLNAFISASVARYKDRVTYWEFLNEPLWVPWYCLPTSAGYTVDSYIGLLKDAAIAMKAADPDCQVIGGISIMAQSALGDEFIEKGGLDYVDIYNLHPYPEGDGPEAFIPWMERIQAAMNANGGRKPIWATELSYWGTDDKPWTPWAPPNAGHWSANRQQASEREAADYSVRQSIILLAHDVEKIFWHSGLEGEVNNGSWDLENPLLDPEAVPQKFFAAQAALANLLGPSPAYVSPLAKPAAVRGQDTANVYGFAFQGPEQAVLAVWSPGVLNNGKRGAGGIVPLGESPVYLTAATMTAETLSKSVELVWYPDAESGNAEFQGWGLIIPDGVDAWSVVGSPL